MPKLITKDNVGQDQFTVASDTKIIKQQVLVGSILPGSPAQQAGLKSTDTLVAIASGTKTIEVSNPLQIHNATQAFAGQSVRVFYQRSGKIQATSTRLLTKQEVQASQTTSNPKGYLGIIPSAIQIQRSTWSAPVVAIGLTKQVFVLTIQGLGHALGGLGSAIAGGVTGNHQARENGQDRASSQVGGPVAIGAALWNAGSLGFNFMIFLIALISLTLALMNVLPIPALDGGRLAMMIISRGLFRRPLSRLAEERIVGLSFFLLIGLIALITIVDVKRFF
jgi:regulator of sigma E protease